MPTSIDPTQIATIFNAILVIAGAIGLPIAVVLRAKSTRIINDVKDIVINAAQASKDGKLTPDEITNVINDVNDIVKAVDEFIVASKTPATVANTTPSTS